MRNTCFMFRFFLLLALLCVNAAAYQVIENGRLIPDGIVLGEAPTSSEKQAAREIARCLEKASGTSLKIISESAAKDTGKYIYVGHCRQNRDAGLIDSAWARNQGAILVKASGIYLAGKDDPGNYWQENISLGTLFTACEFLDRFIGVRWLWPGDLGEVVPKHENLVIADGRFEVTPKLLSSLWREPVANNAGWKSQQQRIRFYQDQGMWLKRHRFSCDFPGFQHGHAFTDYYKRYGQSNPEFFNLLPDGTRRPNPYDWSHGSPSCISMCVSSSALVRNIVDNWRNAASRARTINLNENDTAGECVCADCLTADNSPLSNKVRLQKATRKFNAREIAWENELGSLSDRYAKFYLTVQQEADKTDPNHRILGLIYANYSEPPTAKVKLNERIVLRFCPPFMYPWTEAKVQEYKTIWAGWDASGAKLMFRPNFTLDGYCFPVQYQEVFYDLYTFSANRGMIAADMDSLTGHYAAQGLVNYVIATLNHDRSTPLPEMENDFFSAFGAAGGNVRQYFDYLKEVTMKSGFQNPFEDKSIEGGILYMDLILVADTLFTPPVMDKCRTLLNDAAALPGLDPVARQRVEFLQLGLKNVELTMAAQQEFRKYQNGAPINAFARAVRTLDEFRASIEHTNAVNVGNIRSLEDRHWPPRTALEAVTENTQEFKNWKILFDPENTGKNAGWFQPSFNLGKAENITTDSHWWKQPAGQNWKKRHGKDYLGAGWYFNRFDDIRKSGDSALQMIFLAVDGAVTIYLNGQEIHTRPYPYENNRDSWKEPFVVTLPPEALKTKNNVLALRVEKHEGRAGIWKPVFLSEK